MSFDVLPVGQLRLLNPDDVSDRIAAHGNPTIQAVTDISSTGEGLEFTNGVLGSTEESLITFKAASDRRWYLVKMAWMGAQEIGAAVIQLNFFVDGANFLPQGAAVLAGQTLSLFGPVNTTGQAGLPLDLTVTYALPIRTGLTLDLLLRSDTNTTTARMWIWVWETLVSAPEQRVNVVPAPRGQTVNESWTSRVEKAVNKFWQ